MPLYKFSKYLERARRFTYHTIYIFNCTTVFFWTPSVFYMPPALKEHFSMRWTFCTRSAMTSFHSWLVICLILAFVTVALQCKKYCKLNYKLTHNHTCNNEFQVDIIIDIFIMSVMSNKRVITLYLQYSSIPVVWYISPTKWHRWSKVKGVKFLLFLSVVFMSWPFILILS